MDSFIRLSVRSFIYLFQHAILNVRWIVVILLRFTKLRRDQLKKNVKLLYPVVHFFEPGIAYLTITLHFISGRCSPLKKPVFPNFRSQKDSANTS